MIKDDLQEALKSAMRAQDKKRVSALRFINAAIKQREVDERVVLDDRQVLEILDKLVKQRGESIAQFEKASRQDLVDQEIYELKTIQEFLPPQLKPEEIEQLIQQAISQTHATSIADMGKIMALVKPQIQGRADAAKVSQKIKEKLSS